MTSDYRDHFIFRTPKPQIELPVIPLLKAQQELAHLYLEQQILVSFRKCNSTWKGEKRTHGKDGVKEKAWLFIYLDH